MYLQMYNIKTLILNLVTTTSIHNIIIVKYETKPNNYISILNNIIYFIIMLL